MAIAYGVNQLIKVVVRRPRPEDARAATLTNLSFPSAHATTSFAAARAFRGLVPAPLLYATATAFGLSRPYLGVHYPSDVVAGALLGTALGGAACR